MCCLVQRSSSTCGVVGSGSPCRRGRPPGIFPGSAHPAMFPTSEALGRRRRRDATCDSRYPDVVRTSPRGLRSAMSEGGVANPLRIGPLWGAGGVGAGSRGGGRPPSTSVGLLRGRSRGVGVPTRGLSRGHRRGVHCSGGLSAGVSGKWRVPPLRRPCQLSGRPMVDHVQRRELLTNRSLPLPGVACKFCGCSPRLGDAGIRNEHGDRGETRVVSARPPRELRPAMSRGGVAGLGRGGPL